MKLLMVTMRSCIVFFIFLSFLQVSLLVGQETKGEESKSKPAVASQEEQPAVQKEKEKEKLQEKQKEEVKTEEGKATEEKTGEGDKLLKQIKEAIDNLAHENPLIVDEAEEFLLYQGKLAVEPLIEALNSEKIEIKFLACRLLGKIRDKRAIPHLIKLLADKSSLAGSVSAEAVKSLGLLQAKEAAAQIIEALKVSQDNEFKYEAIKSLAYMQIKSAIPEIRKLLDDNAKTISDNLIRVEAMRALAILDDKDSINKIKLYLDDKTEDYTGRTVAYYAAKSLEKLTGKQFGNLDGSNEEREAALVKWREWGKELEKEQGEKKVEVKEGEKVQKTESVTTEGKEKPSETPPAGSSGQKEKAKTSTEKK